jgi:hypothetical protein
MANQAKYPDYIMRQVRLNLGLDYTDTSEDAIIAGMGQKEILDRCLKWNGLVGYTESLIEVVSDVYGVSLEEGDTENNTSEFDPFLLRVIGKNIIENALDPEVDAATLYQAAKHIELLQWRIETAMKASCITTIDSAQERMEMILRGEYDDRKEAALEGGIYKW